MTTLVGLDLIGRSVLVAGGGPAAAATVTDLLADGALVHVVAPHVCEDMRDLTQTHADSLRIDLREVRPADLDEVWLVVAAQDGPRERRELRGWADARRLWCQSTGMDGSATAASATHAAGLTVGVVAADAEPRARQRRAQSLRDQIRDLWHSGDLDLRAPEQGDGDGRVWLVGGGPGSPDLFTVAGRRTLARADVIVTDRLGPVSVLDHVPAGVEIINVGKSPGHHPVPQHEINTILIEQAQRGRQVVRLKGGDPFVFGRGGEEVLACRAAGVPVTVVPGVSSALAVPAAAGIPLTQRNVVAAFHVTSGHDGLNAGARACLVEQSATVVILMGVGNLGMLVEQALAAGADAATPVAIIERGTQPDERITRAPLAQIVTTAALARVRAPAVIVIGAVADPAVLEPA